MKTLTTDEARVGTMTAEEAGEATYERALQIQGAMAALLSRQSAAVTDWESLLNSMKTTRPWMHLPKGKPFKDFYKWLAAQFKIGGQPMTREQLVAIVDAYDPGRGKPIVAEFETAIEQPYVAVASPGGNNNPNGRKGKNQSYPDNVDSSRPDRQRGTSADYLMAQLIAKVGPQVQEEIGPGRQFASVMAAAVHYGITKRRVRYEVTPDCSTGNAAARIVEVLGPAKAAELVTALTIQLTGTDD
jgi:hypothetical protein